MRRTVEDQPSHENPRTVSVGGLLLPIIAGVIAVLLTGYFHRLSIALQVMLNLPLTGRSRSRTGSST